MLLISKLMNNTHKFIHISITIQEQATIIQIIFGQTALRIR